MCGRIAEEATAQQLEFDFAGVANVAALEPVGLPRYNLAPTQLVPGIIAGADGPEWSALKWWLIPRWAKEVSYKYSTFNAKAEEIETKASFKASFKDRRCLIVATAFYEWEKLDSKTKQPYYIRLRDRKPLTFAGLWDRWTDRGTGEMIDSCTIITTAPNSLMSKIHNRMPVIVTPEEHDVWLHGSPEQARHVLRTYDAEAMEAVKVGTFVSNSRNEGPECVQPLQEAA